MTSTNSRLRKAMTEDRDKGFTLIELLVVIIIIGILAGVAIPVFLNQRKKGVDAGLKSDLKNAATTVETWITDNPQAAIPTQTLTNQTAGAAGTPLVGFEPSPGNTVSLFPKTGQVGAYCLYASNANASTNIAAASSMKYDSGTGGLQTGTHNAAQANCA